MLIHEVNPGRIVKPISRPAHSPARLPVTEMACLQGSRLTAFNLALSDVVSVSRRSLSGRDPSKDLETGSARA